MSFFANDDAKERIRQAVDIADLIGSYYELRREGRNYACLCPWHADSRPSLKVNPERQSWHCFVCNIGGDIFSFVMKQQGVDFRQALELLADRAGIPLARSQPQVKAAPGSPDDKQTLYKALEWCEQQFHECFLKSDEAAAARQYIAERGITSDSVRRWRIGYSPDEWQWLLNRAARTPYTPAVLEAAGMIAKSEKSGNWYDRFKGRVMFPIRDVGLHHVAFGGRVLPEAAAREEADTGRKPAKYVNSPETKLYSKSDQLYGLDIARDAISRTRQAIVTEGYTDVIVAHQGGLATAVACCGTALGARHLPLLGRFADNVCLILDGDEAGQRRTNEIIELFIFSKLNLQILTLPDDLDPCDFVLQRGGEALQALLPAARDGFEHKLTVETSGIDLLRDTLRANRVLENLLTLLARAPRSNFVSAEQLRLREQQLLNRLGRAFGVDASDLRHRLHEMRRAQRKPQLAPAGSSSDNLAAEPLAPPVRAADLERCECELIEILTQHPELAEKAEAQLAAEELNSLGLRMIYGTYLRLLREGDLPSFGRVLAAIDDPAVKSLLVELDERAAAKSTHALVDGFAQLDSVLQALHGRRAQLERRAKLAALEDRRIDESEQLETLQHLIAAKRSKLGISQPTDGPGCRIEMKEATPEDRQWQ